MSSCINAEDEARKTAHIIEGALGFALYAMQGTLESLEDSVAFRYGILPLIVESFRASSNRDSILLNEVQRTTDEIIDAWTSKIRDVRGRYDVGAEEVVAHVFEVARLFVKSALLEQLKFDSFSSNMSTSQWPAVHEGCINDIFSR